MRLVLVQKKKVPHNGIYLEEESIVYAKVLQDFHLFLIYTQIMQNLLIDKDNIGNKSISFSPPLLFIVHLHIKILLSLLNTHMILYWMQIYTHIYRGYDRQCSI